MGCAASTPVLEQKNIGRGPSVPEQRPDASDSAAVSDGVADEYSSITSSGADDDEGDTNSVAGKTPRIDTTTSHEGKDSGKSTEKKETNSTIVDEADGAERKKKGNEPVTTSRVIVDGSASESETLVSTTCEAPLFKSAAAQSDDKKKKTKSKKDKKSSRSKRSKSTAVYGDQDRKAEFFDLLNLDPWSGGGEKLDEEKIVEIIREYPQHCREMYNFDLFHEVFPLSALCALGATVSTVEACFHAYKDAIKESDALVGTPVHYACAYKASLDIVKYLVKEEPGALRESNQFARMPLHMACLFGASSSVISFLVEQYPDACKKVDTDGMAPLHLLCDSDEDANPSDVELLLEKEPAVCLIKTEEDGSTPLHLAVAGKAKFSVLKALVKANDKALSVKDAKGRIPLFVAVAVQAEMETFKLLLLKYPDGRTTKNKQNELPVTMATRMKLDSDLLDLLQPL